MSLANAINDWKRFTTNGGFEVEITLTAPAGGEPVVINGLATKHHNSVGTDGQPINAKNVHITIVESDLTTLDYTVRNAKGEVSLRKHLVDMKDSTGIVKNYVILETFPDETVGVITCILGDYVKA